MKNTVDVRTIAVSRAMQLLDGAGAKYKIITDDGGEYGVLEVVKSGRAAPRYPRGTVRSYYRPQIEHMKVGDVARVRIGSFDFDSIQNGVCNLASEIWGNGSVVTRRDVDGGFVEVLRVI